MAAVQSTHENFPKQRFLSIALALCIGLTMSIDAHAKRFGGGKSFGNAPTHQSVTPSPSGAAGAGAAAAAGRAAPAAGGASRWLGPLAGIAAGGLLASMFMGGGFQGMQIFDILIMAVIAFVIFRFIAARRRKQQEHLAPTPTRSWSMPRPRPNSGRVASRRF